MTVNPINKIIVGLDFTAYSKTVFKQATMLAQLFKVEIEAVYVAPLVVTPDTTGLAPIIYPSFDEQAEMRRLQQFYKKSPVPIRFVAVEGSPAGHLIRLSEQNPNALLVVGYKGRTKLSRFFLGSIAERVSLNAKCLVWIHRGNHTYLPKQIVVPCDLSQAARGAAQMGKVLNQQLKAKLNLVYVHPEVVPLLDLDTYKQLVAMNRKQKQNIARKLLDTYKDAKVKILEGDPANIILKLAKSTDLLVMAPHKHDSMFHTFGKITAKVARSSNGAIVVVPRQSH